MSDKAIIILCSAIALTVLAVSIALAILNRRNLKRIVRILGAGVFLMMVTLIYPSYHIQDESFSLGLALVQSMCAMLLNADAGAILAGFDGYTVGFIGAYKSVLLALLIVAPLFTVGITLSFFSERFARLIYRMRALFRPSFLFSEINERTLCVAEDVAAKNKKAVIVFAVRTEKDNVDAEAMDRIKKIGGVILNDDIVNIGHSLKRERNYYLLSQDGSQNLELGLRLYQKYNQTESRNVNMWLYTKEEVSKVIFDHLYETFNVRLIHEENLITRRLIADYPLYNAIRDGKLSVLIVGAGNVGLEILRVAAACSKIGDRPAELHVIDIDGERAKSVFEKASPRVAEKWNIQFHTADVATAEFTKVLRSIDPTYVVVALGNQNLNLETALFIRRTYGLKNGFPHIHALIDHKRDEKQILSNLGNTNWKYDKQNFNYTCRSECSYEIRPFGSYEETYSDLRIGATYLDCLAVAHNAAYCGVTEVDEKYNKALLTHLYNQVMFYKDLSDGFAVSISYKLYLMGLQFCDDGEGDLSLLIERLPHNVKLLREYENKRYEAFMRGIGWTDLPLEELPEGQMGDKLTKRNARLDDTNVKELTKITGRDFDKEDEWCIHKLPLIISLANTLYGKNYSVREITPKGEQSEQKQSDEK